MRKVTPLKRLKRKKKAKRGSKRSPILGVIIMRATPPILASELPADRSCLPLNCRLPAAFDRVHIITVPSRPSPPALYPSQSAPALPHLRLTREKTSGQIHVE